MHQNGMWVVNDVLTLPTNANVESNSSAFTCALIHGSSGAGPESCFRVSHTQVPPAHHHVRTRDPFDRFSTTQTYEMPDGHARFGPEVKGVEWNSVQTIFTLEKYAGTYRHRCHHTGIYTSARFLCPRNENPILVNLSSMRVRCSDSWRAT